MTPQQQFAARVQKLIADSRALTPTTQAAVKELLDEARKQIASSLLDLSPKGFQYAQLQQLKASVDQAMAKFGLDASRTVNMLQAQAARIGTTLVNGSLGELPLGYVAADRLTIAQGYAADLITGLSKKAAADVNGAIQRAFLGGKPLTEIMSDITAAVGGERAETIATTEVLRVQSIATQASLEDAATRHPDLKKQWEHVHAARMPRVSHIIADGQVQEVDEPFTVDGEELMYPRDPNGSAYNTINCHCLTKPYFDADALTPTQGQRGLLDRLGISVSTQAA